MLTKINNNKPLFLIIFLLFFVFVFQINFTEDIFLYTLLLPIVFVFMLVIEQRANLNKTFILQFFNVFNFLKYFIMPLLIISTQSIEVEGPAPTNNSYKLAVMIMVLECVCVNFMKIRFYRNNKYFNQEKKILTITLTSLFLIFFLLIYLLFFKTSIFLPNDIFQEFDYDDIKEKSNDRALIFIRWFKVIAFPVFVLFLYKFFKSRSYYFSIFLMLVFIYLNFGTRRWDILFFIIIGLMFLYNLYGSRALRLIYPFSIAGFFVFLSISIYKFSWALIDSDNKYLDIIKLLADQFQPYFSGPSLVAQTIDMIEHRGFDERIGVSTFINDFVGSVPGLTTMVDQTDRINYYFNEYIFGNKTDNTSQIVPMIGIGYVYFGLLFSPFFTVFFTWLGFKFETFAMRAKHLIYTYLFYYMSVWAVLAICFSSQIIWGSLIVVFIPLLIFNKLVIKRV